MGLIFGLFQAYAVAEEIVGVVRNMTRNARFRTSFGAMDGGVFRSERLLDILSWKSSPSAIKATGSLPAPPGSSAATWAWAA